MALVWLEDLWDTRNASAENKWPEWRLVAQTTLDPVQAACVFAACFLDEAQAAMAQDLVLARKEKHRGEFLTYRSEFVHVASMIDARIASNDDDVMLVTRSGRAIRFPATDVRVFNSRASTGVRGVKLGVPRERLPELEEDDFYIEDLVGLNVITEDGAAFGSVKAVVNFGAGDLVEIKPTEGKAELYAFTHATFPSVDLTAGTLTFAAPELVVAKEEAAE